MCDVRQERQGVCGCGSCYNLTAAKHTNAAMRDDPAPQSPQAFPLTAASVPPITHVMELLADLALTGISGLTFAV